MFDKYYLKQSLQSINDKTRRIFANLAKHDERIRALEKTDQVGFQYNEN